LDDTIDRFLGTWGSGYGNIPDYFYDVSYGKALVGMRALSRSIGWFTASYDFAGDVSLGNQRNVRVEKCMDAIPQDQRPDLDGISGIVGIDNVVVDGGACGVGPVELHFWGADHWLGCVWFDPDSLFTDFASQEIGHAIGMDHSWAQLYDGSSLNDLGFKCAEFGRPGEYCDPWDEMSAMVAYWFEDKNWPCSLDAKICPAQGGPGLSAPSLLNKGWIPNSKIANWPINPSNLGEQVFTLQALSHPEGPNPLIAKITAGLLTYTVEFRVGDGWDTGFKTNTSVPTTAKTTGGVVLVHLANVHSPGGALIWRAENIGGHFPGDLIEVPTFSFIGLGFERGTLYIRVGKFDQVSKSAKIAIGLSPPNKLN
jgi:hypothetical protein